ncbi:hypothetical protein LTR08_001813 [Meristemomyces frigidus]|nr:hypothetical protein LTR08_001813 [Meristemomyces frigidus]
MAHQTITRVNMSSAQPTMTVTNTMIELGSRYAVPYPDCTIPPKICRARYSTWLTTATVPYFTDCPISTAWVPKTTISTGPSGSVCTRCTILADKVKLLYWPITTEGRAETNLCLPATDVTTIPGTRTGKGPNTFVTDNVTITSPSVGVWMTNVGRQDGCGPTIKETIVIADPTDVSSVDDYHVFASPVPINYANLNTACVGNRSDQCFTLVPSDAYWRGEVKDAQYEFEHMAPEYWDATRTLTISNDYRPYIFPPTVLASMWGHSCSIPIYGIVDPPVALQAQSTMAQPSRAYAGSTTSLEPVAAATPASPGGLSATYAASTSSPVTVSSTSTASSAESVGQQAASTGYTDSPATTTRAGSGDSVGQDGTSSGRAADPASVQSTDGQETASTSSAIIASSPSRASSIGSTGQEIASTSLPNSASSTSKALSVNNAGQDASSSDAVVIPTSVQQTSGQEATYIIADTSASRTPGSTGDPAGVLVSLLGDSTTTSALSSAVQDPTETSANGPAPADTALGSAIDGDGYTEPASSQSSVLPVVAGTTAIGGPAGVLIPLLAGSTATFTTSSVLQDPSKSSVNGAAPANTTPGSTVGGNGYNGPSSSQQVTLASSDHSVDSVVPLSSSPTGPGVSVATGAAISNSASRPTASTNSALYANPTADESNIPMIETASPTAITIDQKTYTLSQYSEGAYLLQGASTSTMLTADGLGVSIGSGVLSAGDGGIIYGDSTTTKTLQMPQSSTIQGTGDVVQLGHTLYTISTVDNGAYIVQAASTSVTLSGEGSAETLGSGVLSLGASGLLYKSDMPTSASELQQADPEATGASDSAEAVVSAGQDRYTVSDSGNGIYSIKGDESTAVLTAGGAAVTLASSEVLSAESQGLLVLSGTHMSIIRLPPSNTDTATSMRTTNITGASARLSTSISGVGALDATQAIATGASTSPVSSGEAWQPPTSSGSFQTVTSTWPALTTQLVFSIVVSANLIWQAFT